MITDSEINKIIEKSGCFGFIRNYAEKAISALEKRCPQIVPFMTREAYEDLYGNFGDRMSMVYAQALMEEIRKEAAYFDPMSAIPGQFKPETVEKAAEGLYARTGGQTDAMLHQKYPLLQEYRDCIFKNYIECFSDFFNAFLFKKEEISKCLLQGRPIGKILHLSTGGADTHRNGRCVTGVKTDAGTIYYKPHDCELDLLYYEIVSRWFSDCTQAAGVVSGEGYAFVSCLTHRPVQKETDIAGYFFHFGILAALFHGLGSNDMHQENIISCADKPSCVDTETILTMKDQNSFMRWGQTQVLFNSLTRTGLLPFRAYKGPLVSPLYTSGNDFISLPEYEGKRYTVEGYETEFCRGFGEGYRRMLVHREEIKKRIDAHGNAAVRCLLRNTRFYAIIRQMLFCPQFLTDRKARDFVYKKLCTPFTAYDLEVDTAIVQYEWNCLLKGDIPYYCTTISGHVLCGEDPGQIIKNDYYHVSIQVSAIQYLDRLSEAEECFEQNLIRVVFAHAPVDETEDKETELITDTAADEEYLKEEVRGIFQNLREDMIYCPDHRPVWMSTAFSMNMQRTCGAASLYGNIGTFCAGIMQSGMFPDLIPEAQELAENVCVLIGKDMGQWEGITSQPEEDQRMFQKAFPTGLYTGLGGLAADLAFMSDAGVKGSDALCRHLVHVISENEFFRSKKTDLAEGIAGLILGLYRLFRRAASSGEGPEEIKACIRSGADRLLKEELPDRADLPYGCAGIGAALAAAFDVLQEQIYADGAHRIFQKMQESYEPGISGWPDGNAKLKWLADRGPHAAGIFLAACRTDAAVKDLALDSMLQETALYDSDSLNQGNAMTVLALLKAGKKDAAGRILCAMRNRKRRRGSYAVAPPGVRSAFDPSLYLGTIGIGYTMLQYLKA